MQILHSNKTDKAEMFNLTLEAVDFVEKNLCHQISIEDVTQQFETSHWHFQRLFAGVVGVPLGQYLRERRLSEAGRRLQLSEGRILDIALEFGFGSEEAFNRSFKNFFGMTPGAFKKSENIVLIESRNKISPEKLQYFWENVQRTPTIVDCPKRLLVGSSIEFDSHFVLGSSCHTKIVPHWSAFKERMHLIPHRANTERIGAILSTEMDLRAEKLTYFSGVEVTQVDSLLEQMDEVVLPAGKYACFENRTLSDKNGHLIDYIYGIWLPSSDYQRAPGLDYEIFDHRYVVFKPESVSHFYVPIV